MPTEMLADANIAFPAALLAEPARVAILFALSDGRALPAGELARHARVTPPTASAHLTRLVAGGLLTMEREGRHRYYRLADPAIVTALEALALIAPPKPAHSLKESHAAQAVRRARTCYDHLAGQLGVQITTALAERGAIEFEAREFQLGPAGAELFASLGVDVEQVRRERRSFARACLDWSERRYHLAGALGAALMVRLLELDWLQRVPASRAVRVTNTGRRALQRHFGVRVY
jgi:DNA-binding transcriptional ArsR family regulator